MNDRDWRTMPQQQRLPVTELLGRGHRETQEA